MEPLQRASGAQRLVATAGQVQARDPSASLDHPDLGAAEVDEVPELILR
jgi:hypothetical protein